MTEKGKICESVVAFRGAFFPQGRSRPAPHGAYFDQKLGEFVLPYEVVRTSRDPEATLMTFLEGAYRTAADLGL